MSTLDTSTAYTIRCPMRLALFFLTSNLFSVSFNVSLMNMIEVTDPPGESLMSEEEMDIFVEAFSNLKKPSLLGILKVYLLR